MPVYVDTSALAKRYVEEIDSARFERFVDDPDQDLRISPLTVTEFHSVLMRRRRMGEFDDTFVENARRAFAADLQRDLWRWQPFPTSAFADASLLIQDRELGLATLDALHLACTRLLGCDALATADRRLARAAERHGLHIHRFAD